jgi:hypothetical protein
MIVPCSVRVWLWKFRDHKKYTAMKEANFLRKKVITSIRNDSNPEKQEVLSWLKHNMVSMFPYRFVENYIPEKIIVYYDGDDNSKYVLHYGKKMYFPKNWPDERIKNYYSSLLLEQDINSPHKYECGNFGIEKDDVLADIGASEGFFALSVIEKVKQVFLFECDESWIESLKKTFEPWKDKVIIVNKYISDHSNTNSITLDDFYISKGRVLPNFIKADIEGAELSLLLGSEKIMTFAKDLRIAICAYHKRHDEIQLHKIFLERNFKTKFAKGYMIMGDNEADPVYLRKGVIRATKNSL